MPYSSTSLHRAHTEDCKTVEAALSGDPAARKQLAAKLTCVPAMVRACHRRLGSPFTAPEVEDLIQDTLTAIWAKLPTFMGASSLETWAYGFGSRELLRALDVKRRRPRREDLELDEMDGRQPDPELDAEEMFALHSKIEDLGPPASDIIRLRHFEELSFEEIAELYACPTNTIKTRYYRGLERLRAMLRHVWEEDR